MATTKAKTYDARGNPIDDDDKVLRDGQHLRVALTMMDAAAISATRYMTDAEKGVFADAINAGQPLDIAIRTASAVKRIEQFDARQVGHRPGYLVVDDAAIEQSEAACDVRKQKLSDAWKAPPPVDPTKLSQADTATLLDDPDVRAALRAKRLEQQWKGPRP